MDQISNLKTRLGARSARWGALVIAGLALAYFGHDLRSASYFADESSFVAQSYTLDVMLAGRWDDATWLAFPAVDQPPLEKVLVGLALRIAGHRRPGPAVAIAWHLDNNRHVGSPAMLTAARWPSVILGAIGCAAIFALGTQAGGLRVGLLAAVLLAGNPLYYQQARRAVGDVPSEALLLASLGVALWGWRAAVGSERPGARPCLAGVGSGLLVGLATLTKLNVGIGLAVMVAWAALGSIIARGRWLDLVGQAALAVGAAAATALLLDPTLTAHPIGPLKREAAALAAQGSEGRLVALAAHRMARSAIQQQEDPYYALRTPREKLKATVVQGFGRFGPLGPRLSHPPAIYDWVQDKGALAWFPWVLAGGAWAAARGLRQYRRGEPPTWWALLIQAAIVGAAVAAYVPMAWDRYFLPLQPGSALLAAGVAVAAVERLVLGRRGDAPGQARGR